LASQPVLSEARLADTDILARRIVVSGKVQGVGFRPFIYRLAQQHGLTGWVRNCIGVVEIHVQGRSHALKLFTRGLFDDQPPLADAKLEADDVTDVEVFESFSILESKSDGEVHISVPTDLFLCDDCLLELNDPSDRRYRYPFINCTQCGPRYTLIQRLPYDRVNTTMARFELCPSCRAEYEDPSDRRFHAEPIACPECGPSLSYHDGVVVCDDNEDALKNAIESLKQGKVIAVKGIGGYHLMCDATDTDAVTRLRKNKPRPDKPLAVMFPASLDDPFKIAESSVVLDEKEKQILSKPARPILLVKKNKTTELSEQIAPRLNEIGMMLPYSPLHHLLLNAFEKPLVATSANISGEPVLIDNHEVEKRLGHVADTFLHHDRPIERPADDPVYRIIADKARPLRTGRGSAPIELILPFKLQHPVLAVGAHMKNVITLAWDNRAVISPHIGEMGFSRSLNVFENTVDDLQHLYDVKAESIICDAHPAYTTTRWAKQQNLPVHSVFHHHAHASSAYYECDTDEQVMIFAWDGVGYGEDETLWGGETFVGQAGGWKRVASMRPFYLPGGDKAGRQPWRSAAALCWEIEQDCSVVPEKDPLLKQAWQKKINAPQTTSVGRLFDAAAALTEVCLEASYEGQGAMEFEALCTTVNIMNADYVDLALDTTTMLMQTNWAPLVANMLAPSLSVNEKSSLFHASLAHALLKQALAIREQHSINTVSFSGGVFQNRVLTESAIALLSDNGFEVCVPELIPVNDAGISFGQVMEYGFK